MKAPYEPSIPPGISWQLLRKGRKGVQKHEILYRIASIGEIIVLCLVPRDESSKSRFWGALALLPCALIALWAAWEYKKTGEKKKVDIFSIPFSDAHPYIAAGIIILPLAWLLVDAIRLAIQGD